MCFLDRTSYRLKHLNYHHSVYKIIESTLYMVLYKNLLPLVVFFFIVIFISLCIPWGGKGKMNYIVLQVRWEWLRWGGWHESSRERENVKLHRLGSLGMQCSSLLLCFLNVVIYIIRVVLKLFVLSILLDPQAGIFWVTDTGNLMTEGFSEEASFMENRIVFCNWGKEVLKCGPREIIFLIFLL